MKPQNNLAVILGVALIIAALLLMKTPAYTFVKTWIMESGGNIGLAVGVAMGLITLTFTAGVLLIREKIVSL